MINMTIIIKDKVSNMTANNNIPVNGFIPVHRNNKDD